MAQTTPESKLLSDSTGQEVKEQALESARGEVGAAGAKHVDNSSPSTPSVAVPDPHLEKSSSQNSTNAQSNTSSSRPSLVPLGSGNVQTSSVTPVAPHPKRFSAVNINKKFLEKNTASGTAASSSSSSIAKSGSPATRPAVQPTSSHSRLVTAKLTASPAVASTAAGWSRPSSVAPSPATNSPNSTSPMPIAPVSQPLTTAAPQLPHAGKVILPQPRNAAPQMSSSQKDSGSNKPVWANVKPPVVRPDLEPNDFPTAAEVANVASTLRKQTKAAEEAKATSDIAAKLLRSEEADAFRGVHLDPNVHHWDEMEEDDDNFLGGVIEFGDGRQYKIESSDSNQQGAMPTGNQPRSQTDESHLKESTIPVSKEERFVDDFDRSWPKSRNSPTSAPRDVPSTTAPLSTSPSVSPVISHAAHSPQDSSRVLFNERSNRLEPYSQSHRQQPGSFGSKRSHYPEGSIQEPRNSRDGSHNIQVLQKPGGGDFASRGRRFSGSSGGYASGTPNGFVGDQNKDREQLNRRDAPPPSPRLAREHHASLGIDTGSRDLNNDRGRKGNMGPPPVPLHAGQKHPQAGGRQLPPHLSQISPNIPARRLPSRDSRFSPLEPSIGLPTSTSTRIPPHSPAISHASLSLVSPVVPPNANLPLSAPELDEVRKDVMHTAAERAKQRRQQEEEEREALKERARRKAQEIEEKMKAEKEKQQQKEEEAPLATAKEKEAIQLIEVAVKNAELSLKVGNNTNSSEANTRRLSLQLPPSLKAVPRTDSSRPTRRLSTITPRPIPVPTSPVAQTESWRVRANPIPTSPRPRQIQSRPSVSANFIPSGPSAAEQVESIADGSKDDLEVVDFSDMGKFVGISDLSEGATEGPKEVPIIPASSSRTSRPVASDFFDESTVMESAISPLKTADFGAWRRKVSQELNDSSTLKPEDISPQVVDESKQIEPSLSARDRISPIKDQAPAREESFSPDAHAFSTKESFNHHESGQTIHVPHNLIAQRTPRSHAFYKEATMSALDDAMSRIKGVLVTMQTHETSKEVSSSNTVDHDLQPSRTVSSTHPPVPISLRTNNRDRWVPPPLRPRKIEDSDEPQEVFLVTVLQPPMSPPSGKSVLRLPPVSRSVEFIHKKQLHAFFRPPFQARMDILSFDPPVPEMSRRDLSLNDVLFRRPNFFKGRINYHVVLPRPKGPKVNIPSVTHTKINGSGAFGRPTLADGAATWRNPVTPAPAKVEFAAELDTTSRSPPPDSTPPEIHVASIPKSSENSPTKSDSNTAIRPRAQPKMPAGSAVAFRRDSRIIEVDATPAVNFIFGSQLDEVSGSQMPHLPSPSRPSHQEASQIAAPTTNGIVKSVSSSAGDHAPTLASSKAENSDSTNDRVPVTPPTHHSAGSWSRSSVSLPMKDSPARAPDPEHLKAVWSQTSNKAGLHSINSLEGIADDLTALPFTLQDVKSEDGETPPPSLPSAPSRMSLHDVTRAFQTVPTSSSTSSQPQHRAAFSPPSTHAPVARPTPATYAYSPAPQNSMRPAAYVPYPSPMMSHSPAPVMYGHPMTSSPVPSRMQVNGHTSLYSQPMWMTMSPSSTQPHGNMMRPVVSPYPAQMMPYPSPGYGPQPPPPNMMPATPQAQNAGRGRGIPVMSPIMSHAHAHPGPGMYGNSPVVLHAVQVPQNHGYMPIPAGRGQPRADNGQMPAPTPHPQQPQPQHTAHNGHHQPSHNGFNPAPAQSFVRPSW